MTGHEVLCVILSYWIIAILALIVGRVLKIQPETKNETEAVAFFVSWMFAGPIFLVLIAFYKSILWLVQHDRRI